MRMFIYPYRCKKFLFERLKLALFCWYLHVDKNSSCIESNMTSQSDQPKGPKYVFFHRLYLYFKSNLAWGLERKGLKTVHPAGLNHLCCQSHSECVCVVWPLNLDDYILIVTQPALQLPLTLCGPTDHLRLFPDDKSHSAAVWPFPWAGTLAVRPHNSPSVSVYSPFCPLCLVPRADLALPPIPAVTTCDILNGGVLHPRVFGNGGGRLRLASGAKNK